MAKAVWTNSKCPPHPERSKMFMPAYRALVCFDCSEILDYYTSGLPANFPYPIAQAGVRPKGGKPHMAGLGIVKLPLRYCGSCGNNARVKEGKTICCGVKVII